MIPGPLGDGWLRRTANELLFRALLACPRLRRRFVRRSFRRDAQATRRQYLRADEVASQRAADPGVVTLMVPTETDCRYEWLELAALECRAPVRIVYTPSELFQAPFVTFMAPFLGDGRLSVDAARARAQPRRHARRLRVLRRYLKALVDTVVEEYRPDAWLSASIGDARSRELIDLVREVGIPWFVTEREGVIAPIVYKRNPPLVRAKFEKVVDQVLVSNAAHKAYWERVGLGRSGVVVVGDLKTDMWRHPERWLARTAVDSRLRDDRLLILYFGFKPKAYIDERFFPDETRDWRSLQQEQFAVLRRIAETYPDRVQIALKAGRWADLEGHGEAGFEHVAADVFVYRGPVRALDLIVNADIILAFQSTAAIESMFTAVPILYGAWGALHDDLADELIPLHRTSAVERVRSAQALEARLRELIEHPAARRVPADVQRAREAFRSRYFHLPPRGVGHETLHAIGRFIGRDLVLRPPAAQPGAVARPVRP